MPIGQAETERARPSAPPAIAIVGPTAAGKTATGIDIAQRLDGEIVSIDSRCIYRLMDIGTAKPTPEERATIPHHLIDLVNPDEKYSVARFLADAHAAIADIRTRGRRPVLVGGTGYWFRALMGAGTSAAVPPSPELRASLEALAARQGPGALLDRLREYDPEAADRIDPNNSRRIIRAIEVVSATGRPYAEARQPGGVPIEDIRVFGLHLSREVLYARIAARYDRMVRDGWVEEVRQLLALGYHRDLPSMSSLGYREIVQHVAGERSLASAIEETTVRCRRFARGQYRWFRLDDPTVDWIEADTDPVERIVNRAM